MSNNINNPKKVKFIVNSYFGITNNPTDDVNPYSDVNEFLNNKVGTLNWGLNPTVRLNSKMRFAYNYSRVLWKFRVLLKPEDVNDIISDDNLKNGEIVEKFLNQAIFQ